MSIQPVPAGGYPSPAGKPDHLAAAAVRSSATGAQIPLGDADTQIMFVVFDICAKLLKTIMNTMSTQSKMLTNIGRLQEEYTKMYASVPTITGDPGIVRIDLNDPARTQFGFENISLENIADYMASVPPGTSFVIKGPGAQKTPPESYPTITFEKYPTGAGRVSFSNAIVSSAGVKIGGSGETIQIPVAEVQSGTSWSNAFNSLMQRYITPTGELKIRDTYWDSNKGTLVIVDLVYKNNQLPQIPSPDWEDPFPGLDKDRPETWENNPTTHNHAESYEAASARKNAAAQARGEKNARLQQLLANISARRSALQSQAQQGQTLLNQTKEQITQLVDIMQKIIDTGSQLASACTSGMK
jgi:hypothetical protein